MNVDIREKRNAKQVEIFVCPERIMLEGTLHLAQKQFPGVELRVTHCPSAEQLMEGMSRLVRESSTDKGRRFLVKTQAGQEFIPYQQIRYCRAEGHRFHIYLTSGECVTSLTIRQSFASVTQPLVELGGFVRCSSSAVVNAAHIRVIRGTEMVLDDDTALSFPLRRQTEAREKLR